MSEKGTIYRVEQKSQSVFIWFLEQDTGQEKNIIKVYAVASDIGEARRQVLSVPGLAWVIRDLVGSQNPSVVCGVPFAEVNISANGKVASVIQAERLGG